VGESRGSSPLYAHLSAAIAVEPEVASVLTAARPTQRRPNLLFAAAHDLLLAGLEHPVSAYYPSVGGGSPPDEGTFAAFRDLVDIHHDEVVARVRSRRTQTNEPGRCAALRSVLGWLAARSDRPVALVELGASAGLLLHLDRYRYRYGAAREVGPSSSPVVIAPALIGCAPTELGLPSLYARLGIDLDPVSPSVEDDARWLRACVWPEDVERFDRVGAALEVARSHDDVELVRGDLVAHLVPVVRRLPGEVLVCVLHRRRSPTSTRSNAMPSSSSSTCSVLSVTSRGSASRVASSSRTPRSRPSLAPAAIDEPWFVLGASTWIDGVREDRVLGRVHPHGAWLEWMPYVP
jgi:hypothetical protein